MRYFDYKNKRLIYLDRRATPEFWDDRWEAERLHKEKLCTVQDTGVVRVTKQYLKPEDGLILEGGCGSGIHVAALTIIVEVSFPLAVISRRVRSLIVPISLGLQIGIRLFQGPDFTLYLFCYVFWVPWAKVFELEPAKAIINRQVVTQ